METTQKAIQAALSGNWKEAISLNLVLLKQNPKDTEALNRLGRAYFETGQKTKAEEVYKKVLRIDKFNTIAPKCLELLKTSRIDRGSHKTTQVSAAVFLEEPGVTKTLSLVRPGDPRVISRLHPGDSVSIVAREHAVTIVSASNDYLGRLPDDLASRLRPFIKGGNVYNAWIRSIDATSIKVFIKEINRVAKFRNMPSFPSTEKLTYAAFTPPELVHRDLPITAAHEDSDDTFIANPESELEGNAPEPLPDDD
ncbi:MAG: tetratricopeptide repeat protein [Patescibacteria group bacterium]